MIVKDVSGVDQPIEINIPPIPLKHLYIDHSDMITYDQETDILSIENNEQMIQSNDLLKAVVTYYTFGGESIGTGIDLSFEMAEGKYKGSKILYNPVIDGQRVDNTGDKIPFIGIPMLLNPLSKFYEQIIQSPELWLYVEEKGDQESGFRAEKLLIEPEIKSDGGVVYIKMNHLTSVGLGLGAMPGEEKEEPAAECVGCEKTSNCFLDTIMGW